MRMLIRHRALLQSGCRIARSNVSLVEAPLSCRRESAAALVVGSHRADHTGTRDDRDPPVRPVGTTAWWRHDRRRPTARRVRARADARPHHPHREPARPRRSEPADRRRRSRPSTSTSRAGRRACRGSATGRSAPASGPAGRSAGSGAAAASTPCSSTPRCRRSPPRTTCGGSRPSSRSTPRRSSTTSSAPTTATPRATPRIEQLKWRANRACFARAAMIVTWAEWTKAGLVERYEVPADKVVVIPPGVDYERWAAVGAPQRRRRARTAPVRILFVGGDLERKGGLVLLDAVRAPARRRRRRRARRRHARRRPGAATACASTTASARTARS